MSSLIQRSARPEDVGHIASMQATLVAHLSTQVCMVCREWAQTARFASGMPGQVKRSCPTGILRALSMDECLLLLKFEIPITILLSNVVSLSALKFYFSTVLSCRRVGLVVWAVGVIESDCLESLVGLGRASLTYSVHGPAYPLRGTCRTPQPSGTDAKHLSWKQC